MSAWSRRLAQLGAIAVVLGAGTRALAAPVSISTFVKHEKTWSAQVGKRQVLEGRCGSASKLRMTMKGCSLVFLSKRPLPRLARRDGRDVNVLVSGRLLKDGGKLFFSIEQVKVQPDDISTFGRKTPRGARVKPEDWYELADWAAARGRFYEDRELMKKSQAAGREGLRLARRLAGHQSSRLEQVAQIAVSRKADPRTVQLIRHELLWALRGDAGQDLSKLKRLAERIGAELEGSRDTNQRLGAMERERYLRRPVEIYDEADAVEQRAMNRCFYATVVLKIILSDARSDGRNGHVIAGRIRQQVPEHSDVADSWEFKGLEQDRKRAGQMNRGEMEKLVSRLRAVRRVSEAAEAIDTWLAVKERSLLRMGVSGRMELADLYLSLKNDRRTAVKWLKQADALSPGNTAVAEDLKRLGYVKRQERWVEVEGEGTVTSPRRHVGVGGIRVGMSGQKVRSEHGKPVSVFRVAAAGLVSEIWVYEGFVVHLVRTRSDGEATVRHRQVRR